MSVLISYWNGGSKPVDESLLSAAVRQLKKKNKVHLVRDARYDLPHYLWPIAKIKTHLAADENAQIDCDVLWDYPVDEVVKLARELNVDAIFQRRESINGNNIYCGQSLPDQPVAFNAGFTYLSDRAKEVIERCLKGMVFESFEQSSTFEQIWMPHYIQKAGLVVATLEDLAPMLPCSSERSHLWAKQMYADFSWRSLFILKCWIEPINFLHLVGDMKQDLQISKILNDYETL